MPNFTITARPDRGAAFHIGHRATLEDAMTLAANWADSWSPERKEIGATFTVQTDDENSENVLYSVSTETFYR